MTTTLAQATANSLLDFLPPLWAYPAAQSWSLNVNTKIHAHLQVRIPHWLPRALPSSSPWPSGLQSLALSAHPS